MALKTRCFTCRCGRDRHPVLAVVSGADPRVLPRLYGRGVIVIEGQAGVLELDKPAATGLARSRFDVDHWVPGQGDPGAQLQPLGF